MAEKRDAATAALEMVDSRIQQLDRKFSGHMQQIAQNLDELSIQVVQMNAGIKGLTVKLDQLTDAVNADRQTVQMLVELARDQQVLAQQQQATVDRLLSEREGDRQPEK